jgi:Zn ribbon nucleic-acid-binding protein
MKFSADSTLRFSIERGFSVSSYILCPVCWNAGIILTRWEDGAEEETECTTCRRREQAMDEKAGRDDAGTRR